MFTSDSIEFGDTYKSLDSSHLTNSNYTFNILKHYFENKTKIKI